MADIGNTPQLPGGNNKKNPLEKKELDILDPEAKAKSNEKKGIADVANDVKDKVESTKKTVDKISKIAKTLGPYGCLVVLIIIALVGIIAFFVTIPGLTIGKLKEFAQGAIDTVQGWFTTEANARTNEEDVINLANYLEEMEYDLVGYGFINPSTDPSPYPTYDEVKDQGYIYYETRDGSNAKYYNEAGELYNGYYYNSLGILINNNTGEMCTDYVDQFGLERTTEEITSSGKGKITKFNDVDDTLLRSYLLSDYKIYAIRNNDDTVLNHLWSAIRTTFGGYNYAWSKGLIKFYYAENGLAYDEWSKAEGYLEFWDPDVWGDRIKINGTKLTIKNGWWNSAMTFDIDGWADRYGMSLEFLLSLHLGTMAPDLVYAMLQNFDTEVQVYLQDSGDAEVKAGYVDMMDEDARPETDLIQLENVESTLSDGSFDVAAWLTTDMGALEWVNELTITRKNAQYLLDNLPLESPPNCTGAAEVDIILQSTYKDAHWYSWDDALTKYDIDKSLNLGEEAANLKIQDRDVEVDEGEFVDFKASNCTYKLNSKESNSSSVTNEDVESEVVENDGHSETIGEIINDNDYKFFYNTGYSLGFNPDDTDNVKIETSTPTPEEAKEVYCNNFADGSVYDIKGYKQTRTWTATAKDKNGNEILDSDGETEQVEYEWVTYKFVVYQVGYNYSPVSGYTEYDEEELKAVIIWEYIIRDKTYQELIDCGAIDENGDPAPRNQVCSAVNNDDDPDNNQKKCCKNCLNYVESVVKALGQVQDSKYKSYTPYIARVLGSWFRDTYFIIPENEDEAIEDYEDEANRSDAEKEMISHSYGENASLVIVDEEYLAETGEYWTKYDMKLDSSGNVTDEYQLYYLYPNGITSNVKMEDFLADPHTYCSSVPENTKYESKAEAEEAGHVFVKKAATLTAKQVGENSTSNIEGVVWSAYGFDTNGASTGWIRINSEDDNDDVNKVYNIIGDQGTNPEGGFYYNVLTTNTVTQVEDAQRSETNPTVKYLFKYRKYYIYDGTEATAMSIQRDREAVLEWAQDTLNSKYGYNWGNHVASELLGEYGRSALRQAYGSFVFGSNSEKDKQDIAEQWLEWQLDMYYSGITNDCPEADIVIKKDATYTISVDTDGDGTKETVTRTGDPRNPELIATVNITKNSLNAFSILENTKTLAAEYSYRDFKELIVELDYFDKEDLSDKIDSVFTWVLPDISPAGWPIRPWDKQNNDYGALIESHGTYESLGVIFDNDSNSSGNSTGANIDESKITFIGDSWIESLTCAESTYIWGVRSITANYFIDHFSEVSSYVHDDTSAIVICLGMNNTSSSGKTQELIGKLKQKYPNIPIYNLAVCHIASDASTSVTNSGIDSYNQAMQSYCGSTSGVTYIDPTNSLIGSDGYLKSEYSGTGGYHLNSSGYPIWYNNIINSIHTGSSSSSSSSSTSSTSTNTNSSSSSGSDIGGDVSRDSSNTGDGWSEAVLYNGKTYQHYLQGSGSWSSYEFPIHSSHDCTIAGNGCGMASAAIVCSAYDSTITPLDTAKATQEQMDETGHYWPMPDDIANAMTGLGVGATAYKNEGAEATAQSIEQALNQGKEVIVRVSKGPDGQYTQGIHYIVLIKYEEDKGIWIINPSGNSFSEGSTCQNFYAGTLTEFVSRYMPNEGYKNGYVVAGSSASSQVSSFKGYEGDELVTSPVTGKVLEYGTHTRTNVYTEEEEEVGYIIIEAMNTGYFTEDSVANNSQDTEGLSNEDAKKGLNLFAEEYEDVCSGYTIMIDGIDVDLNLTDESGNNGTYEENEVMALYNSGEEDNRKKDEKSKADAPYFVNISESAELGSLPEEYVAETNSGGKGYYIKEGKYIGKTLADETEEEPEPEPEPTTSDTLTQEDEYDPEVGQTTYSGPANYIRIMIKDTDYSIIDNVEDFFDIPDPEEEISNGSVFTGEYSEEFLYWLFIDTEGKGGGDSNLEEAITNGYSIAGDIGDGTVTAAFGVTNWCNELFWNLGYEEYVHNVRGSNVGMEVGDHIPIQVCNDVGIAEVDSNVAAIQRDFPDKTFTETQMAALISVSYNFGHIPDSLKNAILSGDEGTIASTWTTLGSGQWSEFPGLQGRREAEYKMWSEGKFYNCYGGGELVFNSATPFTDYLNGNFNVCN